MDARGFNSWSGTDCYWERVEVDLTVSVGRTELKSRQAHLIAALLAGYHRRKLESLPSADDHRGDETGN